MSTLEFQKLNIRCPLILGSIPTSEQQMSIMEMQTENINIRHENRFSRVSKMAENDLISWLAEEKKFWKQIWHELVRGSSEGRADPENDKLVNDYFDAIDFTHVNRGNLHYFIEFQKKNPLPFHDDTQFNRYILDMTAKGQLSLARLIFEITLNSNTKNHLKLYDNELKSIEENFKEKTTETLKRYDDGLSEKISTLNSSIEQAQQDVTSKLEEELREAQQNIANTVSAANRAILSAEPVKYWIDREKNHRDKAKNYLHLLGFTSLVFIVALVILSLSVYKNSDDYMVFGLPITLPAAKFSIALLILATTAAIWITRVLVKLMMTNLALEIEALERSTMIRTYIAMDNTKAEQATEIRMLFYSTLFKPSNNSLTDDSTSPEYIRIIEAMLQKKT